MRRRLVVVGNGMVGQRLVEALRERDTSRAWTVTVLGEEPRPAYDRVGLSSYFAGMTADDLTLVPGGFYDGDGLMLRLGDPVQAIDRDQRIVTTRSGHQVTYDTLVLATGSYAFVPPIPGNDLPGCFVYRTLEDLDAIQEWALGAKVGAVVGGGLLGLEAANALRALGLQTHVVEFAPRLMPVQIDEGGASVLRRHVEALGVNVHLGAATERIEAGRGGAVGQMRFTGGAELATDMVVFSAGVRPRDDLARACGLDVGERGGIVVDDTCTTSDPRVFAIGECALAQGRIYGLVAPGYAMAEVVADRLLGGEAEFTGADMSTKLKLLGVDVASFGDAHGATDGALSVVYADPTAGVYKKLVVSDDAQTLLGGILVGDASTYASLRPLVGMKLPDTPEQLLLVGPSGGALPDGATVCSCNNVTVGTVKNAIHSDGCADVPALKACTRAGTSCGSCVPLLKRMLADAGVAVSKALCEHFAMSRAELFDVIRVTGIATFSELIERHGTGRGCDICKPTVASILASLDNKHVLDGELAALQDTNDHFLANMQRNGTYSVVPRVAGGEITPQHLIVIGEVARDFNLYTKITGGQRIDLFGARVEQLPLIWRRLVDAGMESGHAYGKALRTVKSCVGSEWCRYGVQESVAMAVRLEMRYRGLRAPHKIKSGVSGCARECAEARSKDFGVIATEKGWNLYLGGNGGFTPRHADLFASDLDDDTLVRYIDRYLMFYVRTADRLQRTAAWIESLEGGMDYLRSVIVEDSLGLCDELDAAMAKHVDSYADEWRGVLEDPEKLSRFVSFVNAPDMADPSIEFEVERGQIRPKRSVQIAGPTLEVVGR
ncbi:MAG: nitrite reductase [Frankiales bacterium]|nr:nitrite reductase [Frankiales bacterium]